MFLGEAGPAGQGLRGAKGRSQRTEEAASSSLVVGAPERHRAVHSLCSLFPSGGCTAAYTTRLPSPERKICGAGQVKRWTPEALLELQDVSVEKLPCVLSRHMIWF